VPTSGSTPDLYSIERDLSGNLFVRGFTADGGQIWQANTTSTRFRPALPDGFGGTLILSDVGLYPTQTTTITDLDGITGAPVWSYFSPGYIYTQAIRQDGAVFLVETTPPDVSHGNSDSSFVVALDGNLGTPLFRVPLPSTTYKVFDCNGILLQDSTQGPSLMSNLAIDSDGTVSLAIEVETFVTNYSCTVGGNGLASSPFTSALSLFQVKPDGSSSLTPIHTNTVDMSTSQTGLPRAWPQEVIPDGQGGVLAS